MLLMGIYNGQFIMWERAPFNQKAKCSKAWHRTGFIIRGLIFLVTYLNFGLGWALISGVIAWPIYNMTISIYMGQPIFYIGGTAVLDKYIPQWVTYAAYGLLGIAAVLFLTIWK